MKPRIYMHYPTGLRDFMLLLLGQIKTHDVLECRTADELILALTYVQHEPVDDSLIVLRFDEHTLRILRQTAILMRRFPIAVVVPQDQAKSSAELEVCATWYPALLEIVSEDNLPGFGEAIGRILTAHTLPQR